MSVYKMFYFAFSRKAKISFLCYYFINVTVKLNFRKVCQFYFSTQLQQTARLSVCPNVLNASVIQGNQIEDRDHPVERFWGSLGITPFQPFPLTPPKLSSPCSSCCRPACAGQAQGERSNSSTTSTTPRSTTMHRSIEFSSVRVGSLSGTLVVRVALGGCCAGTLHASTGSSGRGCADGGGDAADGDGTMARGGRGRAFI